MKLLIIGSLLFSGGSAVALQNETVNEETTTRYTQVKQAVVKQRLKMNLLEQVKENGFPYPCEDFLSTLTEDQEVSVLTEIDFINATYDWPNMTDEDITEALLLSKTSLDGLYEDLGIEKATFNEYRVGMNEQRIEDLREDGIAYPDEEKLQNLTEDQVSAIKTKIDEINDRYDWATMTDDEIKDALTVVKSEVQDLRSELGIEVSEGFGEKIRTRIRNRIQTNIQERIENRNNDRNDRDEVTPSTENDDLPVNGDNIA